LFVGGFDLLLGWLCGQAVPEGLGWCSTIHAAALMGSALIVALQVGVENSLHFLDGLEPGPAALGTEVLVCRRDRTAARSTFPEGMKKLDCVCLGWKFNYEP